MDLRAPPGVALAARSQQVLQCAETERLSAERPPWRSPTEEAPPGKPGTRSAELASWAAMLSSTWTAATSAQGRAARCETLQTASSARAMARTPMARASPSMVLVSLLQAVWQHWPQRCLQGGQSQRARHHHCAVWTQGPAPRPSAPAVVLHKPYEWLPLCEILWTLRRRDSTMVSPSYPAKLLWGSVHQACHPAAAAAAAAAAATAAAGFLGGRPPGSRAMPPLEELVRLTTLPL
eukprot:CAMPEP_0115632950 /NCGR_PEP_ID=MMETSP0272-20121206/31789_1 /TAXON_ID=71861 /ORGANISM="Scrippsiella trochoidea, Strain CCMP3099" /LENGTH=235 /DNA_ID=CAMNT_0003069683 /DNA_START=905 /DNA_END=1612 /DNA_ORIENTATION=+